MALHDSSVGWNSICNTCLTVDWITLPPEDRGAVPHHRSRKALEASAEKCPLCAMLLRSAVANYHASVSQRLCWREFTQVKVQDGTQLSDKLWIRELGIHKPDFFQSSPILMAGTGHGLGIGRALAEQLGRPVFVLTSSAAEKEGGEDTEALIAAAEKLRIGDENGAGGGPVWVYGNWWAHYNQDKPDDPSLSKPLLMGVGARFGTSHNILHAAGSKPEQIDLRGSSIRIRTDDGRWL